MTAAHPTLPLGSLVRVHNLGNDRHMVVRINDRGPFVHGRIIDLSRAAADVLGFRKHGVTKVRLTKVAPPPSQIVVAAAAPKAEDTAPKEPAPAFVTKASIRTPPATAATAAEPEVAAAENANTATAAAAAAAGSSAGASRYFVQIGAFRDERGAQELLQNSGSLGMALQVGFSENLYRVLAGPFENSDAAEVVTRELARSGKTAFVRRHP